MQLRGRLERLERRYPPRGPEDRVPPVKVWLPYNGRCDPPGRYPCPGSNAVLVIYDAEDRDPPAGATCDDPSGDRSHGPVIPGRIRGGAV